MSKKRQTIRATPQGLARAETALKRLYGTQLNLSVALEGLVGRSTIQKFFQCKDIQVDKFKEICKALTLESAWEEIAGLADSPDLVGLPDDEPPESLERNSDNSADIDELVQQVRVRCHDRIQRAHGKIRLSMVGREVDLEHLIVNVNIFDKPTCAIHSDIRSLTQDDNYSTAKRFLRLGLGKVRQAETPGLETVSNLLAQSSNVVVLGRPGAGKTTFVQQLVIECNRGNLQPKRVPILIKLRDFVEEVSDTGNFSLQPFIQQEWGCSEIELEQLLERGRGLILLDGLDEVSGANGTELVKQIRKFVRKYDQTRLILSCRTQVQEYIFDGFEYVEVADFNQEQVEQFVKRWFTAPARSSQEVEEAEAKANQFLEKLYLPENQQVRELAVTPLLLRLTCEVFDSLNRFYSKPADLYAQGIKLLLEKWDKSRGVKRDEFYLNLSVEQRQKLLSYVAATKFEQPQHVLFEASEIQGYIADYLRISPETSSAVLRAIEADHGLLVERAQGIYSFSHLTFQEYFAAKWFTDISEPTELEKALQSLAGHVTETHWREVFLLIAGLIRSADELLEIMETAAQKYISTPKLHALLTWANQATANSEGDFKPAVKRAAALLIARSLNYYLDCDIALALARTLDSTLDHTFDIDFNRQMALLNDHERDPNLDFEIVKDLDSNYVLTRIFRLTSGRVIFDSHLAFEENSKDKPTYIFVSALTSAIQRELALVRDLEEVKIFQDVDFKALTARLEGLQARVPDKNQLLGVEVHQEFVRRVYQTWLNALRLPEDWVDLSEEEAKVLVDYLEVNELMVRCKQAAVRVSRGRWEAIEERILLGA